MSKLYCRFWKCYGHTIKFFSYDNSATLVWNSFVKMEPNQPNFLKKGDTQIIEPLNY